MNNELNLQLHFKEFIKADSYLKGIDRIKPAYRQAGKNPDHACDLLVYEPKNIEESQLGTLFMLGKIENIPQNKYKSLDFLLNLLISVIKREFYSDHKRPTPEALESSLNKANLYLADFTEKGNVEWIGNISFICGAFHKNTLHITQVGESIIKLFRETNVSHIENKFLTSKKTHPLKTFGNIASGTMLNGDKVIMGTKNILNITPLANLKELSKKNHEQIIESLKLLAEKRAAKTPVICLVLETKAEAPEKIVVCLPRSPRLGEAGGKAGAPISQPVLPTRRKIAIFRITRRLSIIIFLGIRKTISFLVFVLKKAYKFLTFIFKKIFKSDPFYRIETRLASLRSRLSRWISPARTKINSTYCSLKQNKPAFFIASLLIILVLILPFIAVQTMNYYVKINRFNELSAEIEEVQKKTDAVLIYSEKEKARGLLQKNQILLANLLTQLEKSPLENNVEILNKAAALQEKHQEQQDSINNVIRIKELEEVLDFSTSGFIVNPIGINKIKDVLYFYELDSGILYKFNLSKGDLILVFISAKDEMRKMVSLEKGWIVLFGQSKKVYLYNSNTNDHYAYSINPAIPIEQITDVKSFFSNFYILDAEQGNIIKYSLSQIQESTIKGSNWLSEPLKQAQSMAIDGSIYILDSKGLIIQYHRGKKAEEIKPLIEKPLADNSKIFIDYDFTNLYISDPLNKRLLVLDKSGNLINQYINDEFANLKDFWVTNDEKEVYLLCEKKVYRIEL